MNRWRGSKATPGMITSEKTVVRGGGLCRLEFGPSCMILMGSQ